MESDAKLGEMHDGWRFRLERVPSGVRVIMSDGGGEPAAWIVPAELRATGAVTLRELATELNQRRYAARRSGLWSAVKVARVLARVGTAAQ